MTLGFYKFSKFLTVFYSSSSQLIWAEFGDKYIYRRDIICHSHCHFRSCIIFPFDREYAGSGKGLAINSCNLTSLLFYYIIFKVFLLCLSFSIYHDTCMLWELNLNRLMRNILDCSKRTWIKILYFVKGPIQL